MSYNGWTNYATWRVNLEVLDGLDVLETFGEETCRDTRALAYALAEFVEEIVCMEASGLAQDYALAFIGEVNYHEIAEHFQCDLELEEEEEDA